METSDLMIKAHNLQRFFGKKEAVSEISFTVRRGEIFGLLGPNGAGKTTTIRMLTGQIEPTTGSATVAGCDIIRERSALKSRIGVVFEDQNLYDRLSARDNLDFSCRLYGMPASRIDEVLELVKLRDRSTEKVQAFSNGMRQRLMIARALLHRPQVLFLDEPSRGLDPVAASEIRRTIRQLSQDGITVLLTTHLMEEADQLCSRVAFVVNGRIAANDTPRNLKLARGQRLLTVTLDSETNARSDGQHLEDHTLSMDKIGDQDQLMQWLQQGRVRSLHSMEGSLEDVFISMTGVQLV